ncbi:DUF1146 family protein [Ectobacillus antri]|uniref:DUF1146 family protein n=1 Tax=Ectobacillus antri TaxID=2486280 RepID=A0ABT6H7B1_9BACI|nr:MULTISPECIES: DUF1146 family protein [Ectobacillus]MDG4658109.1 DUF1146 family protein [Ectobacillus antri]MDG5754945.1 DUF1146 family protein [Ectobacillus antri]UOY91183.1 DUF1146 family protein [Ectobacillus sp. JY-23]
MSQMLGQQALIAIISHLFFISVTWWALQGLRIEELMKKGKVLQTKVLLVLLTVAIGSSVSNFFLDYLGYSKSLPYILQ